MFKKISLLALLISGSVALAQSHTPPALSDGEISKVLLTINDGEIDASEVAKDKTQNKEVKDFAKTMIKDHKSNMKDTKKLAKTNNFDLKDSDLSKSLKEEAKDSKKSLKKSEHSGFDQKYVELQISMHQKALDTLDGTLIPNAQSADLKMHLQKTREAVAMHLKHAKNLDEKIKVQ